MGDGGDDGGGGERTGEQAAPVEKRRGTGESDPGQGQDQHAYEAGPSTAVRPRRSWLGRVRPEAARAAPSRMAAARVSVP